MSSVSSIPLRHGPAGRTTTCAPPPLLRKLAKYRPLAEGALSCARVVYIKHNHKKIKFDLYQGDIIRPLKNIKFAEGKRRAKGFDTFNHHTTSASLIFNRRVEIFIPSIGTITLSTQNRGVKIDLNEENEKALNESSFRGALVSELCACPIPKLSTILPSTKSQEEIDYANNVLEKRWKKEIRVHEKWNNDDPQTRGPEPSRPAGKPDQVSW